MVQRVVIHADDVGFCHGAIRAFVELSQTGAITAGSVMVPCPWFTEIAQIAAADAASDSPTLDVGVHLTLTSEHAGYRWGPVSNPSSTAGLTDSTGNLWPSVAEVREHADPDAVEIEWRAQLERALAAGLDVTHLDAHMGAALAPEWCDRYVALGAEYQLPTLITSTFAGYGPQNHLRGTSEDEFAAFVDAARAANMPIVGTVLETDFGRARGEAVDYRAVLGSTDDDLVYCAFHPCAPGPGEVEVIEPGANHVRTDEYHLFSTDAWLDWLDAQPFERIGMRELRDEMRVA